MLAKYRLIKVYTSEDVIWQDKPVWQAVIDFLKDRNIAGRCFVSKGMAGYFESGDVADQPVRQFSFNLPLKIEIIVPAEVVKSVVAGVTEMVGDGMVIVEKIKLHAHRSTERLIPQHLKIAELMTTQVDTVEPGTPVDEVIRKMLATAHKSVPVVDAERRVLGIITQENLSGPPHLPLRLGLLARLEPAKIEEYLNHLPLFSAAEVMSTPVVTVNQEQHILDAIKLMLKHRLKRLPVVNSANILVGMVSRIDILRAINQQTARSGVDPAFHLFQGYTGIKVKAIRNREFETVRPETPVYEVAELIYSKHIQRVAVVDADDRLVGLISDYDLLPVLKSLGDQEFEDFFIHHNRFKGAQFQGYLEKMDAKTASEVMTRHLVTVEENRSVEEAIRLMTEKNLKRLPVVDSAGRFQGLISREALLRAITN
ncbi:DUF190 domain-containing protein [Hydrogenispora ethanolica]|nr:DUF190 domain-containing protein [Hydrogenispora ethanolica]